MHVVYTQNISSPQRLQIGKYCIQSGVPCTAGMMHATMQKASSYDCLNICSTFQVGTVRCTRRGAVLSAMSAVSGSVVNRSAAAEFPLLAALLALVADSASRRRATAVTELSGLGPLQPRQLTMNTSRNLVMTVTAGRRYLFVVDETPNASLDADLLLSFNSNSTFFRSEKLPISIAMNTRMSTNPRP